MILFTQSLVHQGFLQALGLPYAMSTWQFALLAGASICIAAAGYIINDIQDIEIDRINKPHGSFIPKTYSEDQAFNFYLILNITGVALGFLLAYTMGRTSFAMLFVLVSALLYVYAVFLKKIVIIGNLVVSALVAFSIFIVVIFDIVPVLGRFSYELANPLSILRDYALFAMLLNFLREIVKDLEDIQGDYNQGIKSLPIVLGRSRTAKLTSIIATIYIFLLIGYVYTFLYGNPITAAYLIFAVCGTLFYFSLKAWSADGKQAFTRLTVILKVVMILGILSLAVLTLSLKYAN